MGQAKRRGTLAERTVSAKKKVKEFGAVMTPPGLVNEMIDKLPEDSWKSTKTFIDPSCGTGNFLVEVISRKLAAGHNNVQVALNTFGVDIQSSMTKIARKRLFDIFKEDAKNAFSTMNLPTIHYILSQNIKTADFLAFGNKVSDWTKNKVLQLAYQLATQDEFGKDKFVALPIIDALSTDKKERYIKMTEDLVLNVA